MRHSATDQPHPWPWPAGLAAATSLLFAAGLVGADPPAPRAPSLFAAARAAVVAGQVEKTRVLGFHDQRRQFTEVPPRGAVLIGFDCGVGKFMNIEVIYALRPIWLSTLGEEYFQEHGLFSDRFAGTKRIKSRVLHTVRVRARRGYAVGGVTLRSGLYVNGLSVTFLRINGDRLDPQHAYTSAWVGDRTGGGESFLGGSGAPVVGLFGSQDDLHVQSLGLMLANVPPPEPPAIEQPAPVEEAPAEAAPPEVPRPKPRAEAAIPPLKAPAPIEPLKAERPANAPRVEPPAEPPPKAAEPAPVAAQPKATPATSLSWLAIVLFAAVGVPALVLLLVPLSRRKPAPVWGGPEKPTLPDRAAERAGRRAAGPAVLPPADATAICTKPRTALGPRPLPAVEAIPVLLPAEPEVPANGITATPKAGPPPLWQVSETEQVELEDRTGRPETQPTVRVRRY